MSWEEEKLRYLKRVAECYAFMGYYAAGIGNPYRRSGQPIGPFFKGQDFLTLDVGSD
jgi:hypothetical protein